MKQLDNIYIVKINSLFPYQITLPSALKYMPSFTIIDQETLLSNFPFLWPNLNHPWARRSTNSLKLVTKLINSIITSHWPFSTFAHIRLWVTLLRKSQVSVPSHNTWRPQQEKCGWENSGGLEKSEREVACDHECTAHFQWGDCWLPWGWLRVIIWGYRVIYKGVQSLHSSVREARGVPDQDIRQTRYFLR